MKRCIATIELGTRCAREAADQSNYCWQHGGSGGRTKTVIQYFALSSSGSRSGRPPVARKAAAKKVAAKKPAAKKMSVKRAAKKATAKKSAARKG